MRLTIKVFITQNSKVIVNKCKYEITMQISNTNVSVCFFLYI